MNIKTINQQRTLTVQKSMILLGSIAFFLIIWWLATKVTQLPEFILPSPQRVFYRFIESLFYENLLYHL
jgi:ABC-type nitrate/sulfonate/bicarbonate transport system permease component